MTRGEEKGKEARERPSRTGNEGRRGKDQTVSSEIKLHDRSTALGFVTLMWGGWLTFLFTLRIFSKSDMVY